MEGAKSHRAVTVGVSNALLAADDAVIDVHVRIPIAVHIAIIDPSHVANIIFVNGDHRKQCTGVYFVERTQIGCLEGISSQRPAILRPGGVEDFTLTGVDI